MTPQTRWTSPTQRAVPRRVTWVPAAFVLFSLLALLLAPLILSARTESLRRSVVEPGHDARGAINDILHGITSGEAAVRGLLLTGDQRFLERIREAREAEQAAFHRLVPLARLLDEELGDQALGFHERTQRAWEARADLFSELETGRLPSELLTREEGRHERLVGEAEALKTAIVTRTEAARTEVHRLRQLDTLVTIGLALLALVAAIVILRASRVHRIRAQEEAELRAAAFSLTEATEVGDMLRRIAAIAARPDRGESSYVERVDQGAAEVEVVASVGDGAPPVRTRVPYPGSLTEEAVRSGATEVVVDIGRADRPMAVALAAACDHCVALVIPLVADREPEGALVIIRPTGSSFSDREVEQRRAMGILAALVLRRSVLLERAREQHQALQRAVESRERLVRGFSHDLKNPLGAADGHAQLLADGVFGDLTERQRDSVLRIRSGIGSALELISSLIELARSEAGQLEMVMEPVDVGRVVRETARVYRGVAESVGLQLETELLDGLPPVRSDPERIRQVLGNLLSNAIKFTPAGGTVRVRTEARSGRRSDDPSRWVTISVQDTGPGISTEEQERLFTEFQRLDPHSTQGEGLGLAISDRVATLLGGEITVDSEPGRGSTFTFWIPADKQGDANQ